MGVVHGLEFQEAAKAAAIAYPPEETHRTYKDTVMAGTNGCAELMIPKWEDKIRNASLNMVENCQTMFIHLVILDP